MIITLLWHWVYFTSQLTFKSSFCWQKGRHISIHYMRRAHNFIAGILISNRIGHYYLLCGHQEIDKMRKYGIVFSSSRHLNTSSWIYRKNHGYRCYLCYGYIKIMLKLCIFIPNPCLIVFCSIFSETLLTSHLILFSI